MLINNNFFYDRVNYDRIRHLTLEKILRSEQEHFYFILFSCEVKEIEKKKTKP